PIRPRPERSSVMPRASRSADVETAPISTLPPPREDHQSSNKPQALQRGRTQGHPAVLDRAQDFETFAAELHRDLPPSSRLQPVLTDRVILAAWRLHRISRDESACARARGVLPRMTREVLRAESSLETALTVLRATRDEGRPRWGHAAPTDSKAGDLPADKLPDFPDLSNEWPAVPNDTDDDPSHSLLDPIADDEDDRDTVDDTDDNAPLLWRHRLTLDPNVSETSPVVQGTWVPAGQVVSLIVDGWTWSDILRTHPELTEDDIRACLAYTVTQDAREEP